MSPSIGRRLATMWVSGVVTLTACDEKDDLKQSARAPKGHWQEERELLSYPSRAAPELERRLRGFLRVRGGLVTVADPRQREVFTLPADSPWVVSCGYGLTIHLGVAPDGDHEDIVSLVELGLTPVFLIARSSCDQLTFNLGRSLQKILAGE